MLFLSYRCLPNTDFRHISSPSSQSNNNQSKKDCYFINVNSLGYCKLEIRKEKQKEHTEIEALSLLFEFLMLPTHGSLKSD